MKSSGSSCHAASSSSDARVERASCSHCLDCCSQPLTFCKAALIRSANSSSEWKEWWPAGIQTPTVYFHLRFKQLEYLQGHKERNASELWRPLTECNYAASALLRRRHAPPLALYVPAAMTGVEGAEDRAIRYLGAKLMGPQPAPPCRDRAAAKQAAAAAAAAATARATALAYQQQAAMPPSLTQQRPGIPAQVAALQAPVAAALAAAKQLAAAAAAAAPALGGLPRDGSKPSAQSMQSSGGSLHRVPRCLDVPLLSPAGSSDSLSVASSSDSFGGVLRQLAAQGSPRSPECCPLPQPSVSLLRGVCAPNPDKHTLGAPMPPPSQQQHDRLQRQQMCTAGCAAACACASARLQSQREDCKLQQQAAP